MSQSNAKWTHELNYYVQTGQGVIHCDSPELAAQVTREHNAHASMEDELSRLMDYLCPEDVASIQNVLAYARGPQ